MKRHKKLVSLLIALCFVFSLVPMAAASTAPAPHPADGATARLNTLGIVEGYPDGTFGLNRDITRAEFAKIAVSLVGMKDGADMLRATPSQFSDVRTDVWYTGWINMASGLGLIKGDPAGTFRPNDRITNGEVVTILLRALGYNDNLPGAWPVNYLARAARLEITIGVPADARAAAVRGNVFIMANRTLDTTAVKYDRDTNTFEEELDKDDKEVTLLAKNFKGDVIEDSIVVGWRKAGNRYEIEVVTLDTSKTVEIDAIPSRFQDRTSAHVTWLTLAKDATISGTDHVSGLSDRFVNYATNKDGEITFVERRPYTQVNRVEADREDSHLSEFEWLSSTRIRMGDVNYNLDRDAWVMGTTAASSGKVGGERIRLILNKDGEVAAIRVANFDRPALVDSVIPARHRISVKANASNVNMPSDLDVKTYVILRGTKEVGIADLKPWELLYVTQGGNGVDWSFTVVDRKATGVLDVVQTSGTTVFNVRLGGTNYSVSNGAQVSTNNGDEFNGMDTVSAGKRASDLIGEQVTVYLDHSGDVVYMVGDARGIGAAGNYGQVVKVNPILAIGGNADGIASVELLLANGTKATYLVDGNSRINGQDGDTPAAFTSLVRREFVEFRLRADGRVDRMTEVTTSIASLTATTNVDIDNNRIRLNDNWFLAGDAVVFNVTGTDVERIANWTMVEENMATVANMVYVTSGNRVTHLAVSNVQLGAAVNYAVVMETGADRDGEFVRLMDSKGAITRYDVPAANASDASVTALRNKLAHVGFRSVVDFEVTGTRLVDITEVVDNGSAGRTAVTVTAIDRTGRGAVRLEIGTTNIWFSIKSDTVLYNLTGTPRVITLADLSVGDQVVYNIGALNTGDARMIDAQGQFNFLAIRN